MAIVDGWIDWATRIDGVPDKVYSEPNKGLALIGHSIVGSVQSALNRFLSTDRNPDGSYTDQAAASSMFLLAKSGELIQMYPVTASTWTSGGREANTSFWAIETEGGGQGNFSEPLTDAQVETLLRLATEFEQRTGRKVVKGTTFREHGETAKAFGYSPTACPSGRYQRFYDALEASRPAPIRLEEIVAALGGIQAIRDWNAKGNSLLVGYGIEQEKVAKLFAELAEHKEKGHD